MLARMWSNRILPCCWNVNSNNFKKQFGVSTKGAYPNPAVPRVFMQPREMDAYGASTSRFGMFTAASDLRARKWR